MDRDVDISQNLTVAPDGDRILDESETWASLANIDAAIAGAPTVAWTPRPRLSDMHADLFDIVIK